MAIDSYCQTLEKLEDLRNFARLEELRINLSGQSESLYSRVVELQARTHNMKEALPMVRAQFQEPAKEELQMTSDPKAPGASAVYLYREEITDENNSTTNYYARIKILTEQGKEMATERFSFVPESEKIVDVEGRTIHADGDIFPLTEKPAVLEDFKIKEFQHNELVVTLPNVAVGSILEYRVRVKYLHGTLAQPG